VSHARSGLPPLKIQPFDPSELYAAAQSSRLEAQEAGYRSRRRALITAAVTFLSVLAACGALLLI
jgi:hypothetical protein